MVLTPEGGIEEATARMDPEIGIVSLIFVNIGNLQAGTRTPDRVPVESKGVAP
jgi:hypothetical protein